MHVAVPEISLSKTDYLISGIIKGLNEHSNNGPKEQEGVQDASS